MEVNMFPVIDNHDRLEELAGRQATTSNWTAVVVDRQGDVFGTDLGNGTWAELGSAVPCCLSGRIALPARLVAGQALDELHDQVSVQDQISGIVHAEDTDEHYDRYWSDRVAEQVIERLGLPKRYDAARSDSGDAVDPFPDVKVKDEGRWRYFRRGSAGVALTQDGELVVCISDRVVGDPAGITDLIACLQQARQTTLAAAPPSESGGQ